MTLRLYSVFKPSFRVIAQGSKEVLSGEEVFRYDPGHYLISCFYMIAVRKLVIRFKYVSVMSPCRLTVIPGGGAYA